MAVDASSTYDCFGKTSAAAPVVTGGVVLLRRWFRDRYQVNPSPAMIKAMLVAHAADLHGGYDHLMNEVMPHSPSMAQGWGRVDMGSLFGTDQSEVDLIDQTVHLSSGQRVWYKLEVVDPSEPAVIVLTWSDAPAQPNATSLLVNDLILRAHDPYHGGAGYQGNLFASEAGTAGTSPASRNPTTTSTTSRSSASLRVLVQHTMWRCFSPRWGRTQFQGQQCLFRTLPCTLSTVH